VKLDAQGRLVGDMFDGAGFVRGVQRKGFELKGKRALVVGTGGVGSDIDTAACEALAQRLVNEYPQIRVNTGSNDPDGHDLVVNATPMGMNEGDPLPVDVSRLAPETFVGEVVMRTEMTAFLQAAHKKGCRIQLGSDMLFEQIPAYLEYFGFQSTTADVLRNLARLS
jgi:shikimate dehydrogenase